MTDDEPQPPAPLSIPEYAKHRRIPANKIHKAIQSGRLETSIIREGDRWWIPDAAAADVEWTANTRQKLPSVQRESTTEQIGSAGNGSGDNGAPGTTSAYRAARDLLAAAQAEREQAMAGIAQLNLRSRRGELIEAADARAQITDLVVSCKTKLLGLPTRIAQGLPHLAAADVRAIAALIREALEELADSEAP